MKSQRGRLRFEIVKRQKERERNENIPYGEDMRLAIGSTCDMRFWEILNDFERYI